MKYLKEDLLQLLHQTGNSPASNLIQEAKNGKAKAKIYINKLNKSLYNKSKILQGYVTDIEFKNNAWKTILKENPQIKSK